MSGENLAIIAGSEVRGQIRKDGTLEERMRAAMKLTRRHWLVTDEDTRMKAAIAAVFMDASEEEQEQLKSTMNMLTSLSAVMSGVPVNMEAAFADFGKTVPLIRWWQEEKDKP